MLKIYRITNAGKSKDSPDLVGLLIAETVDGFYLVSPGEGHEQPRILARSALFDIFKKPLVTFKFHYMDFRWTLNINGASDTEMHGIWINNDISEEEEDSWTATGAGAGEPGEDEARAAYGK